MSGARSWRLTGGIDGLTVLLEDCRRFVAARGVPLSVQRDLVVALEEIATNVIHHGTPGNRSPAVEASVDVHEGVLVLVVSDDGPAFDPLAVGEPPRDQPVEDRPVGGLGILLFRRLMDSVTYERVDGRNRLELRKRFQPGP